MKLIVQIPCFNEAETLPRVLCDLPSHLPGIDIVEVLVIDDGSSDQTSAVAVSHGVSHVVRNPTNLGLAAAFSIGLQTAIKLGADIIINTDGDHQYPGTAIEATVRELLLTDADIVIGDRQPSHDQRTTWTRRMLQRAASRVTSFCLHSPALDPVSGLRAYRRKAAGQLGEFSGQTYTLQSLFRSKRLGLRTRFVSIETNCPTRPSRLIRSQVGYIANSAWVIASETLSIQWNKSFQLKHMQPGNPPQTLPPPQKPQKFHPTKA